ncbi:MAG: hypothetical protein AAB401_00840 [Acidobacteriota bacterium]
MNLEVVNSVNGVPIRLTDERWWDHIVAKRPFLNRYYDQVLEAVESPLVVLRGYKGTSIGVLPVGRKQYLHVVYKEISREDGFIITVTLEDGYNKGLVIWRADQH